MSRSPARERRLSWALVAAFGILIVLLSLTRPLALPDEGRYAEIGRWMWLSGDWLAPRLNGLPFFHKPPLLHWLQAGSIGLWGAHPGSARLVPALHAVLMLAGLYLAMRRMQGETRARLAVIVLGSSSGWLLAGQYVNHDMLVAAWISLAVLAFGLAFLAGPRPAVAASLAGCAACALAVLSKGLIGVVLPGAILLAWLAWTRQLGKLRHFPWLRGLAVFLAIALPWFWMAQARYPGLFDYLIVGQHFSRYAGSHFNNQWPAWFYPAALTLLMFPWALALWWRALTPRRWRGLLATRQACGSAQAHWQSLLWCWLLVVLVFFSIPASKIVGYILPVMPAVAGLVAMAWPDRPAMTARRRLLGFAMAAVAVALALVAHVAAGRYTAGHSAQDAARFLACARAPGEPVYSRGDYPYDLPFLAQLEVPMVVIEDWPSVRRTSGDNWRRELFEAGDFDPVAAARLLQSPATLADPVPGSWLVQPRPGDPVPRGWHRVFEGRAWAVWQFSVSAPERPEPSQREGLHRCHAQGEQQR